MAWGLPAMAGNILLNAKTSAIISIFEASDTLVSQRETIEVRLEDLARAFGVAFRKLNTEREGATHARETCLAFLQDCGATSVIIGGDLLEGIVSSLALSLVSEGYDVFVCADQCSTADHANRGIFFDRLVACTVHVTTLEQARLELTHAL